MANAMPWKANKKKEVVTRGSYIAESTSLHLSIEKLRLEFFLFSFVFRNNIDTGLVLKGPPSLDKDGLTQSQAFL